MPDVERFRLSRLRSLRRGLVPAGRRLFGTGRTAPRDAWAHAEDLTFGRLFLSSPRPKMDSRSGRSVGSTSMEPLSNCGAARRRRRRRCGLDVRSGIRYRYASRSVRSLPKEEARLGGGRTDNWTCWACESTSRSPSARKHLSKGYSKAPCASDHRHRCGPSRPASPPSHSLQRSPPSRHWLHLRAPTRRQ